MRQHSRPILTRSTHSMLALAAALVALTMALVAVDVPEVSAHQLGIAGKPAIATPTGTTSAPVATTTTPSATATASPTAKPTPTPSPSPTLIPTPPTPPASPAASACMAGHDQQTAPFLEFCAPLYAGQAEGPNGTRVTVVLAYDRQATPDALYFFLDSAKRPATSAGLTAACSLPSIPNTPTATVTPTTTGTMCFPFVSEKDMQQQILTSSPGSPFVLTVALNAPADALNHSYYVVADYSTAPKQPPTWSHEPFTVLSTGSPCVTIAPAAPASGGNGSGDTSRCAPQDTPVFLDPGDNASVQIQGANWLPASKIQVEVTATCLSVGLCTPTSFVLGDAIQPNSDGSVSFAARIPTGVKGYYFIQAWSTAPDTQDATATGALMSTTANPQSTPSAALIIAPRTITVQDCAPPSCTVPSGATLAISGQNWPPGTPILVYLIKPSDRCTLTSGHPGTLPHAIAEARSNAKFATTLSLTGLKVGGSYDLCANNMRAPQHVTIGSATAAAPIGTATTLSWIALALALASLGLYVVLPHRRAI